MKTTRTRILAIVSGILSGVLPLNAAEALNNIKDIKIDGFEKLQDGSHEITLSSTSVIRDILRIARKSPEKYPMIADLLSQLVEVEKEGVSYDKEYTKADYKDDGVYQKGYEKAEYDKQYAKSDYKDDGVYQKGYEKAEYDKEYSKTDYNDDGVYVRGYDKDAETGAFELNRNLKVTPEDFTPIREEISAIISKYEDEDIS